MPIHDWSRIHVGVFHHFHQAWTMEIANALNAGVLPSDYFALTDQFVDGVIPDVVTLRWRAGTADGRESTGGVAVAEAPPRARFITSAEIDVYAARANRIAIHDGLGDVVAVVEVISPGNKSSAHALRAFLQKSAELLRQGISLLVVDLFPPSPRDPQGIHKAIWDEICDEPFTLPPDKPLTVAAYSAGELKTAYVEPVAVGDLLPSLPIFLETGIYVPAPLEASYETTWSKCPKAMRDAVEAVQQG